jgi:hypothetical protein
MTNDIRPTATEAAQVRAALEWRALFNGIVAAIFIGVGILVSWASGAFNDEPGHRENGAAGVIAGIICLIGIGIGFRAWHCYRASRELSHWQSVATPPRQPSEPHQWAAREWPEP